MKQVEQARDLCKFVEQRTSQNWSTTRSHFLNSADGRFWLPRRQDLPAILQGSRVAFHGDQNEIFDCDDYAVTLKSRVAFFALRNSKLTKGHPIACGIFWGHASWSPDGKHAGNWFVTREGGLVWVEPQFNNSAAIANGHRPLRPGGDIVTHLEVMMF